MNKHFKSEQSFEIPRPQGNSSECGGADCSLKEKFLEQNILVYAPKESFIEDKDEKEEEWLYKDCKSMKINKEGIGLAEQFLEKPISLIVADELKEKVLEIEELNNKKTYLKANLSIIDKTLASLSKDKYVNYNKFYGDSKEE